MCCREAPPPLCTFMCKKNVAASGNLKSHGSAVPDLVLNCTVTIVHRRLGYTHMKCEPSVSCGCAGGAGNAAASGREGRFPASNAVCLLRVSAEKS